MPNSHSARGGQRPIVITGAGQALDRALALLGFASTPQTNILGIG